MTTFDTAASIEARLRSRTDPIRPETVLNSIVEGHVWVLGRRTAPAAQPGELVHDRRIDMQPGDKFTLDTFDDQIRSGGEIIPLFTRKELIPHFTGKVEEVFQLDGRTLLGVTGDGFTFVVNPGTRYQVRIEREQIADLMYRRGIEQLAMPGIP